MSGANIQVCYKKYHMNTGTFSISLFTLVNYNSQYISLLFRKKKFFLPKIFFKNHFLLIFFILRLCFSLFGSLFLISFDF